MHSPRIAARSRCRTIAWGFGLQFVFALLVLKTSQGQWAFEVLGEKIRQLLDLPPSGRRLCSAPIGDQPVWARIMNTVLGPEGAQYGVIFAFQIAPTIIFIAALFAILYYFGIMQIVVRLFAVVMNRVMGASGAESLNVAASIFMGQTEAPLTIRPYLPKMTQSELMTVMTSGMAHISGGIMAAYIAFGIEPKHLLTAVIMTAPGTLMMAKMFVPETETPETMGTVKLDMKKTDVNVIDAAGRGTGEGLHLAMNVIAMLISFIALIALLNAMMSRIGGWFGHPEFSLQMVLRLGVCAGRLEPGRAVEGRGHDRQPARHAHGAERVHRVRAAGSDERRRSIRGRSRSRRSRCAASRTSRRSAFRSAASARWCPSAGHDLARLGLRAMLAGTLANFVSACIAALLL